MKLRHPNPGDRDEILSLARTMHAESWYSSLDYNEAVVAELFEQTLTADHLLALVLETSSGELGGFFLAAITSHFFGRDTYACDLCAYVAPSHRGGPGFIRMIAAYEAWCRIKRVKEIHIGFSSGIRPEKTLRLYEKLGFQNPVTAYRKKCVWPD